ncbi:recombinase family protein [Tabrizicola sp. WMC-M-20]|nr:recombinase family protein [Tabrizicola sp. WMC-M-20]
MGEIEEEKLRCFLTQRKSDVYFVSVDMPEANDLTVGIMALVVQAEGEAISRRMKEALAVAMARGVKRGSPPMGRLASGGLARV